MTLSDFWWSVAGLAAALFFLLAIAYPIASFLG